MERRIRIIMKIVYIKTEKMVKKSKKEIQKELSMYPNGTMLLSDYKNVPIKEPIYVVEMSAKEIQLVSFYLELENRKPIMNVELKTEIKRENKDD